MKKTKIVLTITLIVLCFISISTMIIYRSLFPETSTVDMVKDSKNGGWKYIQGENDLGNGEIAMYDSNGHMYAAQIDESYYSKKDESSDATTSSESRKSKSKIDKPQYQQLILDNLIESKIGYDEIIDYQEENYKENGYEYITVDSSIRIDLLSSDVCRLLAIIAKDNPSEMYIVILSNGNQELYTYNTLDQNRFIYDTRDKVH